MSRFEEIEAEQMQLLRENQTKIERLRRKLITPEAWDAYSEMSAIYENAYEARRQRAQVCAMIEGPFEHPHDANVLQKIEPLMFDSTVRMAKLVEIHGREMDREQVADLQSNKLLEHIVGGMVLGAIIGIPIWIWLGGFWAAVAFGVVVMTMVQGHAEEASRVKSQHPGAASGTATPSRNIPQATKIAVSTRDGGRCVRCGSVEDLQYDHVTPFSHGGTADASNIQLLCGRCNRSKGNRYAG